jgi:DNA mismatch repair protein MutL
MAIRFLNPTLINQIAAGEVIERPASAIKEMVENAIDAGATKIEVMVRDGGRSHMVVSDNGAGMSAEDLKLAVERHATSKIPDEDLFNIRTMGFRGEALPSIGAVSRLTITTRQAHSETAWQLHVNGGIKSEVTPASLTLGTKVEVRDLFFATPARLKFLKSPTTELHHIEDILQSLALAHPHIQLCLMDGERKIFHYLPNDQRIATILSKEFYENSIELDAEREGLHLKGVASIPTYNKSNSLSQHLFVNGRPVKDKLLATAVRVAYQDYLASNRYPALCLFLQVPPEDVDVNVHPAKAEVRFRDPQFVRGFLISALRQALDTAGQRTSTTISAQAIATLSEAIHLPKAPMPSWKPPSTSGSPRLPLTSFSPSSLQESEKPTYVKPLIELPQPMPEQDTSDHPLGFAKAQIHETFIIAEAQDTLIIVDQHAAHERLVYEKFKHQLEQGQISAQALLIPEIIELTESQFHLLVEYLPQLQQYGFVLDFFGSTSVVVREVPTLLEKIRLKQFFMDMIDELKAHHNNVVIKETFNEILADKACRNSIRAGRKLSVEEMNALLRQMEQTPYSGQCNHGRPTYVKLSKQDLEKLFDRR